MTLASYVRIRVFRLISICHILYSDGHVSFYVYSLSEIPVAFESTYLFLTLLRKPGAQILCDIHLSRQKRPSRQHVSHDLC